MDAAEQGSTADGAADAATAVPETPAADELEPQLKYERLGADVKCILQDATATCLCLSEKVLALGSSAGNVHILDYSGNEVKRFSLHTKPVKHISFEDKAEYFATCCGDNYISISSLYTDETTKFTFKRPITVVALEPRYASRKTREFVTGDIRGRLKLSSQGWLGRSDHVLHQGEGTIRAVNWHSSTLVWANDVGVKVYDTNIHQFVGSIKRPRSGSRFSDCCDCQLYVHDTDAAEVVYVAWPDCIKVADVLTHVDPVSGAVSKALRVSASIPTDYFCMGVVPHGNDLGVLVYVTDQDPDLDQISDSEAAAAAAAAAGGAGTEPQQQRQLTMQALPQHQQQQQQHQQQQQQQEGEADQSSAAADAAEASGPSVSGADIASGLSLSGPSGPINIPQPVRRGPRAANAFVRSPSGPSYMKSAAAAAVAAVPAAGSTAATAATGTDGSTGVTPSSTPGQGGEGSLAAAAAAAAGSGSSSPNVDKGRTAAAAGSAAAVQRSPSKAAGRPPLPNYSRTSSAVSRASNEASAIEGPYIPSGRALRPELRILSLAHHSSSAHTHGATTSSAAGTLKQQQQMCSVCSEVASDALSVKGYEHYLPSDYHLVPSYGNEFALLSGGDDSKRNTGRDADAGQGSSGTKSSTAAKGRSSSSTKGAVGGSGASSRSSSRKGMIRGAGDALAGAAAGSSPGRNASQQQQQQQQQQQLLSADASASAASAADATGEAVGDTDSAAATADLEAVAETAESGQEAAALFGDAAAAAAAVDGSAADILEDFREFMYFIVSPQDIVIGRHRDMEDRISWCLAVGRYEAALSLAEADRTTSQELWGTVVQAYLESLTTARRWGDAAAMLPRLLKDSGAAWERWLFTFAQARQLPLLAPVLPVKDPLLPSQAYDLVLQALLVDPSHHDELLDLVSSWPHAVFTPTKLIDSIAQRMQRPGGEGSRELWQVLALLYKGQGRPDLSLAIYLQLQLPTVFDFIQEHGLLMYLDRNAYLLMAIDEKRALDLLASHLDTLPPGAVVPGLLDAMSACESKGDEADREVWRHRLFNYLDKVFAVEASAVSDYAELCVHLYADYCPSRLMDFLQGSQTYPLEAALEVAQQRNLIDEQVYVLSRMGNSAAALRLIIRNQQDIPRAIEFVRLQQDEELWEELIDWALSSADTTGQLLDHIGGNINPLRVIQKIPEGLAIDKLRDRLRAIIADFRTQTSLREGCNAILRSDCLHLVQRLQREVKRAMPTVWLQRLHTHGAAAAVAAADGSDDTVAAVAGDGAGTGPESAANRGSAGGAGKAQAKGGAAAAAAVGSSSSIGSYLPHSISSKGPHWLRYQCGSGKTMQPQSSQDVPAFAAHALATLAPAAGGLGASAVEQSSRTGAAASRSMANIKFPTYSSSGFSSLTGGMPSSIARNIGSSIAMPLSASQPGKVWIGRPGASAEDGCGYGHSGMGPEVLGVVSEVNDEGGAGIAAAAGSAASSRRASSRQQTMRLRGTSGEFALPSLVAA